MFLSPILALITAPVAIIGSPLFPEQAGLDARSRQLLETRPARIFRFIVLLSENWCFTKENAPALPGKEKGVGRRFTIAFGAFCVVGRAAARFASGPSFLSVLAAPALSP